MNTEQIRNNCPNCSKWAEEGCHPKCIKCQNIIKIFEEQENNHNTTEKNMKSIIINKGTGAGGANTNYNGKKFESKTNNQQRLLEIGYTKNSFTKKPKKRV